MEEYMVPIVSSIYGKKVKCSNYQNLSCRKTETDTDTGTLSRIAQGQRYRYVQITKGLKG